MSYYQMIRDLMAKEPEPTKVGSWITSVAQATQFQPEFVTPGGHPVQPPLYPESLIYEDSTEENDDIDYAYQCPDAAVLFEFEGWQLESYDHNECDWVSHYCEYYKWKYRLDQWQVMADGICPECCKEIPEEVMAVWKLKNFDKLPHEELAKAVSGGYIITSPIERPENTPW